MAHNKTKANNPQSKNLILTCAFSWCFLTTSVSKNASRWLLYCSCDFVGMLDQSLFVDGSSRVILQVKPPRIRSDSERKDNTTIQNLSRATRPQLIVMSLCWSPRQMWVLGDQNSLRSWPFHCDCSFTGAEFKFKPRHVFSITSLWLMMAINNHINWIIKNWIIKNRIAISQWIYHSHYDAVAEFFIPSVSAT